MNTPLKVLVVEDEKLRYEICVKLPHITDIYKKDLIFEYIKYDLFINFFYSLIHALIHSLIHSLVHSHSIIHPLIYSM